MMMNFQPGTEGHFYSDLLMLYVYIQKLYTYAGNKDGYKALVAAQYANVKIDIPPFRMGVDNKSDDFYKMSPRGQVRKPKKSFIIIALM